jgi:hypothetical protein
MNSKLNILLVGSKRPHNERWHRAFARHSKIPQCCVDYWISNVWNMPYEEKRNDPHLIRVHESYLWAHCPCLGCYFSQRHAAIHLCHPACRDAWARIRQNLDGLYHGLTSQEIEEFRRLETALTGQ